MLTGATYGYLTMLLIVSGIAVLVVDVKIYKRDKLIKEMKVARFAGWFNLAAGLFLMVFKWFT